jgi:hypothetical protein
MDVAGRRAIAQVLQPDHRSAGGNDDVAARGRQVSRAEELVALPQRPVPELEPRLAAPAVAVELELLLHVVPRPPQGPLGSERMDARPERGEVDAAVRDEGAREDRLADPEFPNQGAPFGVEHDPGAGHRAEMEIVPRQRGRGYVVAVGRSAPAFVLPENLEGRRVDARGLPGGVHDVDLPAGDHGRREDGVRQGNGGQESQRLLDVPVRDIAGAAGVELGLGPAVLERETGEKERDNHAASAMSRPW